MNDSIRTRVQRIAGKFIEGTFTGKAGVRRYKLFIPVTDGGSSLPLIVMLHGCTQTPDDFAVATGMNELAATHQCAVAYPAQAISANRSKCWNWFKRSDQQRDSGEPAIIAGLTRRLIKNYGLDSKRVYVAGLSAGGAMAVIMGRTYPDLYAAIGVHSGLPYASAYDATSAFAAMQGKLPDAGLEGICQKQIPTILLHGDDDKTVHPNNAERLAMQFVGNRGKGSGTVERRRVDDVPGGRSYTHTSSRDPSGRVIFEYFLVHGGGHAWFGGNPEGPNTDSKAPNATRAMLRFFLDRQLE